MRHVIDAIPPAALQIVAIWLLLGALLLADEGEPTTREARAEPTPERDDACPFCGAVYDYDRPTACWCWDPAFWG